MVVAVVVVVACALCVRDRQISPLLSLVTPPCQPHQQLPLSSSNRNQLTAYSCRIVVIVLFLFLVSTQCPPLQYNAPIARNQETSLEGIQKHRNG